MAGLGTVLACWAVMASTVSALGRLDLYPFGLQQGDTRLPVGDDVSSDEVEIEPSIVFYDNYYSLIYVNLNGHVTFETELPGYRSNVVLPIGFKVIAPFLADVDTRLSGNVYYRQTRDPSLLSKLATEVRNSFPEQSNFDPDVLFIATWDEVGHYERKYDETNTFQLVIGSNGRESYAAFLYPDDGINWIQGDGKDAGLNSPDVPAQVGFDSGRDNLYLTLPGSGNSRVTELASSSNVGTNGLWLFRIGDLGGDNVQSPNFGISDEGDNSLTCADGGSRTCHHHGHCVDYPGGYCCECDEPIYAGNGRECVNATDTQRISGRLSGTVNGIVLNEINLHSYAVQSDGRMYLALNNLPAELGYTMTLAFDINGIFGFLFANRRRPTDVMGFQITGGQFNRTAVVQFLPGRETLTIRQTGHGQDAGGHVRVSTTIDGRLPIVPRDQSPQVEDFVEEYKKISPGVLKSSGTRVVRVVNSLYTVNVEQTINYVECGQRPLANVDNIRISSKRSHHLFHAAETEPSVRYFHLSIAGDDGDDVCREAQCDPNASCVPQGTSYECVCNTGFEGTGRRCRDIDECRQSLSQCDENAECENSVGSYQCRCFPGFTGDGFQCQRDGGGTCDVLHNCHSMARCEYDYDTRSYACRCNTGYTGDGYHCVMRPAQDDCNSVSGLCDSNAQCIYDTNAGRFACRCNRGFEGNGQTCTRTDCRRDSSVCTANARCERRGSENVCVCRPGFQGDGYERCFGGSDRSSYLLYAQGMYIMNVPFSPSSTDAGTQTLYIPGQTAVGIDADCISRYFYYTDVYGKTISRAQLDGTDSEVIVRDLSSPEGVAVDWVSKNLYWTDSGLDRIEVSRLNGTKRKTLFSTGLVNPRAIAVDPARGLMFWTDWNREAPKVEKSNMDGTDRQTLVSEGLGLPNGLTIDYESQQICIGDAGTRKVECFNYDGRGRRVISQSAGYPFGIAFANGALYWTDWERSTLPNSNKLLAQSNQDLTLPLGANGRLYGIAAVNSPCPSGSNSCTFNNGGCRFLCLPTSRGGRTCACPDDISPDECNRIGLL